MEKAATARRGRPPLLPADKKAVIDFMVSHSQKVRHKGMAFTLAELAETIMEEFHLFFRLRDNEYGKKGGKIRKDRKMGSEWWRRREVVRQAIIPLVRIVNSKKEHTIWYQRIPDMEIWRKLKEKKELQKKLMVKI